MFRPAKTCTGSLLRKALAFILAYSFVAVSSWGVVLPVEGLPVSHPAPDIFAKSAAAASINHAASHSALRSLASTVSTAPMTTAQAGGGATTTIGIFGPEQYVRTTGPTNVYTTTVQVPAWVGNPFTLHIQNGEADGTHRVSSGSITINNVQAVAAPSDFNQNVFTLDRNVTLTAQTTMVVSLDSKPGSYLRINLSGNNLDHTAPVITVAAPGNNSAINTPQTHLSIHYQDLAGTGEPASGINITSLKVLLDGVDRTSFFSKLVDEASADLPASLALAEGPHTISASIQDNAGNTGQATAQFQVDVTPPALQILQPAAGVYLQSATPQIQLQYSDNFAIDTATLKVTVNGVDRSALFTCTATGAAAILDAGNALPQGANEIVATINDKAGNPVFASVTFNIDTTPPVISIVHPLPSSRHGSSSVEFLVQFSDDQAIDPASAQVVIDGNPQAVTQQPALVSGLTSLADGTHTLTATVKDKAGNQASTSSTFSVDTSAPDIHILQPQSGAILNTGTFSIQAQYSDSDGIDPASFKALIDSIDLTSSFSVSTSEASATPQTPLADGTHTVTAQVADLTGNIGRATNSVLIDTVKPQLAIISPAGPINVSTPTALAQYSDSGSGINPNSVHVLLDGADVTGSFSVGNNSTTGILAPGVGLGEGAHSLRITVADKAGNLANTSSSFLVDLTPPMASFTSPANNSFINNTQPALILEYSDTGSGILPGSIHIFLQQGSAPENEITALFTVGNNQASATIPASAPLVAGVYHLRAQLQDKAGNITNTTAAFEVDTTPPTYLIQSPAANSFLNTATPLFAVTYQDDSSGVDPAKFALRVDGVDHTSAVTATETGASGTLDVALADGPHQVEVTVVDRAGNTAPVVAQSFLTDTVPPTISITAPVSSFLTNNNRPAIAITYADSGSGIDATSFTLSIDGVDQTAGFSAALTGATGSPVAALLDGTHTITAVIKDVAGNTATAIAVFTVDSTPPQITITQPADGLFTNALSLVVTGTVIDASPVTITIEGQAVPLQGNSFTSAGISLGTNATQAIHIVATDAAGNTASVALTVNVDRTPPVIVADIAPPPNATGWNNTPVTVTFTCTDAGSGVASCSGPISVGTEGANQVVNGAATDRAGNTAQLPVSLKIDKTPPLISASAAPPANAAGWNNTDVAITYLCSDSLSGIAVCPPPATVSSEGAAESFSAQAVDQAGNVASISTTLNIDKTPPIVTATIAPPANGAGWNNTDVTVTYSCSDGLSGVASCPATGVISSEGQNQSVPGQARDVAGNIGTAAVTVSIDKTAPTIIQITAPDHISRLHGGQVSVTVNDNFAVSQVIISANDTQLGTFSTAPYQVDLQVPATANPGDTVTITVVATDEAGNTQTSSRGVRVSADGVVVGQVLSDATSFPIPGAVVQTISKTSLSDQTDDHGRYSLQVSDSHLFVTAVSAAPATTTVEREVFVQEGVGTVPVDARLTPLAAPVAIGTAGGTLVAGNISIAVPAATVGDGTSFQLTPLSGQGLPGLLPLGWSPVAAFDLRATSSVANLLASFSKLPNVAGNLVLYNPALHAWTMVASNLQVVNGGLAVVLPAPASYALVVPDVMDPPIAIPVSGDPLTGIDMQLLSPQATSSGALSPATLPPSGGTSTATLGVQTITYVPSGTVIQANVSEKFSLKSGSAVSDELRSEDIVLYSALAPTGSSLGALFPVAPSHKFANTELLTGEVDLDILAGREGVRGQPGGSDPLTLSDGTSTLFVPGGALSEDTAISVQSIALEDFIPVSSTLNALQETLVDFSGETLNTPAQLSISATALDPTHTFLLAKVERLDGVPRMVAAALAKINGANLTTVASPGLPGVIQGGEYVFYDITAPVGFAQGIVSINSGPVQAIVQSDSLPIVDITDADGRYIVPALAGPVNLTATVSHTNLLGSISTQVTAGQTATANIVLTGTVTNAVISPADGSLGVPASTTITVTATAPLNAQSIQQANLVLLKGTAGAGTPVALQSFVLSNSGTVLSFAPQKNLDPATQYTVQVSGLADIFGGAVIVPQSTFTTKAVAPPNFDPNAITFSFPDANGNIHVSAPAGSLPPGTRVMIIDQTSGLVLSLTAVNDGSISGDFLGTINDLLQVIVTDPNGATASFTRSQFVAPDGTVAVGSGGGTVTGPGGVELRIPEGALDQAATFKIEAFGPDLFPERPDIPGANFGSGLKITSPEKPVFKKEVKLAFPKPADAPDGAFFEAYRRMQGPDGQYLFEHLDRATVEGQGATAQVVTASFPFSGYSTSYDAFVLGGPLGAPAVQAGLDNYVFLMWMFDQLRSGVALGGAVTGRVRYAVPPGGGLPDGTLNKTGDSVFVGVPGVVVTVDANESTHVFTNGATSAITQQDGTFTFGDPHYTGGSVKVVAYASTGTGTATAVETTVLTDKSIDTFSGPLLPFYRNVAFADIVVPAPAPPPPTPKIAINLYSINEGGYRVPVNGLVTDGTPLVIAFKTDGGISQPPSVTINGLSFSSQVDSPDKSDDPFKLDFALTQKFIPSGPGIYNVVVTGLTAFAQPITVSKTFMVIGAGGGTNTIIPDKAPEIVSTTPQSGATGVPVNSLIEIVFSEPVINVPGHLSLVPDDGSIPPGLVISGINYKDGSVISNIGPADAVSSVTIQPQPGLRFSTHYKLQVTPGIVDLDNTLDPNKPALDLVLPEAKTPPQPITFMTFGPEVLGGTASLSSTRVVVMGDRAYVATSENASISAVKAFDISDPVNPVEIDIGTGAFIGRAQDTAGEENAGVIAGGNLLAVGAGVGGTEFGLPSNIWLYNVSGDQIQRVGAVSATGSTVSEGQILRLTLKGDFAYTGTYPLGIQVVDLQQAISEYTDVFTNNPVQFGQQITTDGEGFARDAVINTIPIQDSQGRNIMVFGIKADDFTMPGSDPQNPTLQRLVIATGAAPAASTSAQVTFMVADPTGTGPGALLYSGPLQTGNAGMNLGVAVALGQLTDSLPDVSGNLPQRPVAVVVGNGTAPDSSGNISLGGVLAVVDMTVPSNPLVMSMIKLESIPTDVLLKDNMAVVGTGENKALLINLADPRHPVSAGSISGGVFGDKLAITSDGFLISSSMNGALGGIHTATFKPVLGLSNTPILARETGIDQIAGITSLPMVASLSPMIPAAQQTPPAAPFETVADATVVAHVFSATPTSNGTFSLDRSSCGLESVQVTLDFGAAGKVTKDATITVPKGTQFCATTIPLLANVNTDQGRLSNNKPVPAGVVTLVVDSNNDTNIDVKDEDKTVHRTMAFQFWTQDPTYLISSQQNKTDFQNGKPLNATKGLADYATVRVKVGGIFPKGSLSLKFDDHSAFSVLPTRWSLTEKVGQGTDYLTKQTTATSQINSILATQNCDPNNDHLAGECHSDANNTIQLPFLRGFEVRDFLFACFICDTNTSRTLVAQYTDPNTGQVTKLDAVKLDIRSLQQLITVLTARSQPSGGQPKSTFTPVDIWLSEPSTDPFVPTQLTVFVHGFQNSQTDVIGDNIPTYFKRLYWANQPVLSAQKAGFVGVSWPSDPGITNFPDAEMLALETGVPFAKLITHLKAGLGSPKINVIAHSLGNMVVNSALLRLDAGQVQSYVMNEAALPAETFKDPSAAFGPGETNPDYVSKVTNQYGYPDDVAWLNIWLQMAAGEPTSVLGNPDLSDFNRWNTTADSLPSPKPRFYERWTQVRPAGGIPDSASEDIHNHRGPWKGYFFNNIGKVPGGILNTWSSVDGVLGGPILGINHGAWDIMQRLQKPDFNAMNALLQLPGVQTATCLTPLGCIKAVTGDITQERALQFWATMAKNTADYAQVFGDPPVFGDPSVNHYNIIRQWEELSFWFESLSIAAGNGRIGGLTPPAGLTNFEFTSLSSDSNPLTSHSYMTAKPYYDVVNGFIIIRGRLKESQ